MSNQIVTQAPTLPEKLRKEHQPKTGDVYDNVSERAPVFRRGKKAN